MEKEKKKVLIVIDVQNDFVTGSLGTPEAQAIIPNVKKKFDEYKNNKNYVILTKDTHHSDYADTSEGRKLPEHCMYGTKGWEIVDELDYKNLDSFMVCCKSTFGFDDWDWEETLVPMGIPCIEITNTHPDFAWVVQWIECILQVELWKPCAHATIGHMYRELANDYYKMTCDNFLRPEMACSDFGMRGMSCMEEAVRCSSAWLLSFDKTSTIPAIDYIDTYYDACCWTEKIGIGAVSTEHSCMASNFAVDGDEITFVKRLLTELYPNASFSMVSDTYDYWNMIDNILPACKKEIMQLNGKLLVRPDSGDMVEIAVETIEKLWNTFGGTVNSKGYKVLDPHIGIIYGDGCTLNNVKQVWEELKKKGFAANNIVFGVGAFCFSAVIEPDGHIVVVTRDMFGIAMKATYGIVNGEPIMIYKDPKTDTSHLKKSHKGCCCIYYDDNGALQCKDGYNDVFRDGALRTVFVDGKVCNKETFEDIRERLNGGNKDE